MIYLSMKVSTWHSFDKKIRSNDRKLLLKLDRYPNAILVAGCQRSGTTALARLITLSDGMTNYWFGKDDELDAALILSGHVEQEPLGQFCFQTTYINDHYHEYFEHDDYKLIWLLRSPHSVVYSMLNNWKRGALNRLFRSCGALMLPDSDKKRYQRLGVLGFTRFYKACLSYNAKTSQIYEINNRLPSDRLLVLDYDELVKNKESMLPALYQFIGLAYRKEYARRIHSKSTEKSSRLSNKQVQIISERCMSTYNAARTLISNM